MNLVTGFPISLNWKFDDYHLIFVIIDHLIKIIYYEPVVVILDVTSLE